MSAHLARFSLPGISADRWDLHVIRSARLTAAHEAITAALSDLDELAWDDVRATTHHPISEGDCERAERHVAALQAALAAYRQAAGT